MADTTKPTQNWLVIEDFPVLGVTTPITSDKENHHGVVHQAQTLLEHNRYGVDFKPGKIDGQFGWNSAQATYRAKFWLGYAISSLTHDHNGHKFGPGLRELLLNLDHPQAVRNPWANRVRRRLRILRGTIKPPAPPTPPKTLGVLAIETGKTQLGTREDPPFSNRVKYSLWYPMIGPWCAMFVSWCLAQHGFRFRWASVAAMYADAAAHRNGLSVTSSRYVRQGDIVTYDFGEETFQHTGFFDQWIVTGRSFYAVEGNTTAEGLTGSQSNGGTVARRIRDVSNVSGWIRVNG